MTGPEEPASARASTAAAVVLAAGVAFGALFLGAPPRFSAGTSGPAWMRDFLASLAPLAVVEASAAAALGILVASECLRRESPALPGGRVAARTRLPLVLLFAWGCVQLAPLPAGVLRVVAPYSARTYASLAQAGDETMRPISLWPAGTAHALFNLAGVLAACAATWALVRRGPPRRVAAAALVFVAALATAESAHGLLATKLGEDRLLGAFEKASDNGRVTGTFIHATMLSVWAGMGACAALGLAAAARVDVPRRRFAPPAFAAAAVCAAAAFFSLSRLGVCALGAGVLATWSVAAGTLSGEGRRRRAALTAVAAAVLVVAGVVAVLASSAFRQRFGYLFTPRGLADLRFPTWTSAWDLFRKAPVVGTGLGAFGRAVRLTQSVDCPQPLWFAHSDPLNLLTDAGLIGAALGVWWIVATLRAGLPALRSADAATRRLAAGAFGAAAVVLVASLADFQTQFPVVAIPFAALATIPAALADAASPAEASGRRAWLFPPRTLAAGALSVALVCAAAPFVGVWERLRDLHDFGFAGATRSESLVARAESLLKTASKSGDEKDVKRAESLLREAARLDPLLDDAHLWTAFAARGLGEPADDVLRALGRTRVVARGDARADLLVGLQYLDLLGTSPAPYGPAGDDAAAALREAGALEPKAFVEAWRACLARGMGPDALREITPDRGYAKIRLFDHLRSVGRRDEAVDVLKDQLRREPWDVEVSTRLAAAFGEARREPEGREFFKVVGAEWPESR